MYNALHLNVADIVGNQRIKLASMNLRQSKSIVDKTQTKLLYFLKYFIFKKTEKNQVQTKYLTTIK